jgi:hypothetical protein
VYVRPFPSGEGQWKISIAGGEQPRGRWDGRELFLVSGDGKMMLVPVKAEAGAKSVFDPGTPNALFEGHLYKIANVPLFEYDVTPDGKRFFRLEVAGIRKRRLLTEDICLSLGGNRLMLRSNVPCALGTPWDRSILGYR